MAIDARIRTVIQDGNNLILELAPRVVDNKHLTLAGQERLVIENFTHIPASGQAIWGGADMVHIEPGFGVVETRHYRRIGSTRLQEKK